MVIGMGGVAKRLAFLVPAVLLAGCATLAEAPEEPDGGPDRFAVAKFPIGTEPIGWNTSMVAARPRYGVTAPGYMLWVWDDVDTAHMTSAILYWGGAMVHPDASLMRLNGNYIRLGVVSRSSRTVNRAIPNPISPERQQDIAAYLARHPLREPGQVFVHGDAVLLLRHLPSIERAVGRPARTSLAHDDTMWAAWDNMLTRTHVIDALLSRGATRGSECWHVLYMGGQRITIANTIIDRR